MYLNKQIIKWGGSEHSERGTENGGSCSYSLGFCFKIQLQFLGFVSSRVKGLACTESNKWQECGSLPLMNVVSIEASRRNIWLLSNKSTSNTTFKAISFRARAQRL